MMHVFSTLSVTTGWIAICASAAWAQPPSPSPCAREAATGRLKAVALGSLSDVNDPAVSRDYLGAVLEVIRESVTPPPALTLQTFSGARAGGKSVGVADGSVTVQFLVGRDGTINGLGLESSSMTPALDSALVTAIRAADLRRLIPAPFDEHVTLPVRLRMTLAVHSGPDPKPDGDVKIVSAPFWAMDVPTWPTMTSAEPQGVRSAFQLPDNARQTNNWGVLTLQFVIDDDGQVLAPSVMVASATYGSYWETLNADVKRWAERARFKPAMVGHCPARWLTRQVLQWGPRSPHPQG